MTYSSKQQTTELPPANNHTEALPNSSLPAPKHPFIQEHTPQLSHPLSPQKSCLNIRVKHRAKPFHQYRSTSPLGGRIKGRCYCSTYSCPAGHLRREVCHPKGSSHFLTASETGGDFPRHLVSHPGTFSIELISATSTSCLMSWLKKGPNIQPPSCLLHTNSHLLPSFLPFRRNLVHQGLSRRNSKYRKINYFWGNWRSLPTAPPPAVIQSQK